MKPSVAVLALLGAHILALPAHAMDEAATAWCSGLGNTTERLACFDRLAKEGTAKPSPTTSSAVKKVDASDLYVSPNKYMGKEVQITRVRCYHADASEYRCVPDDSTPIAIFTVAVTPEAQKAALENDCGEIKKSTVSPRCLKTIRFIPEKAAEDTISGYRKRVIVLTPSIEVEASARGNR